MDEISSWFKQKRELLILLSLLIFLGVFSAVLYHTNTAAERKHFQIQDEHKIYLQEKNINTDLKSIVSDVLVLGGHHEMQMMVIKLNSENRDNLTGEFFRFCQDKKLYDQVRFLDKTGMEIIRVNFNNGDPTIVPKDQLQLKADRYYFSETLALGPTEIFVSPLDLNIENGEIEWPLKPMIRLGLPIFDGQGQKRGVIILNYLAEILLNDFDEILHDDFGENILLNSDGYFLKAPQSELEWGFMFEERKDRMFGHIYPDEWEQISSNQQGQFVTANGQFTFKTLYLPQGKQNMPTSSRSQSLFSEPETPGSYWKIVSRLSPMKLNENARRFFYHLILVDCVLGFLACAVCFAMTRMRQKREFMDQEMRKLSQAVEQSPASVIITDLDGTITYVNPKFTEISGYSADEAIGQNPKILKSGYASSEEYKELWKTITAGHEWRGEFKNKKKNG